MTYRLILFIFIGLINRGLLQESGTTETGKTKQKDIGASGGVNSGTGSDSGAAPILGDASKTKTPAKLPLEVPDSGAVHTLYVGDASKLKTQNDDTHAGPTLTVGDASKTKTPALLPKENSDAVPTVGDASKTKTPAKLPTEDSDVIPTVGDASKTKTPAKLPTEGAGVTKETATESTATTTTTTTETPAASKPTITKKAHSIDGEDSGTSAQTKSSSKTTKTTKLITTTKATDSENEHAGSKTETKPQNNYAGVTKDTATKPTTTTTTTTTTAAPKPTTTKKAHSIEDSEKEHVGSKTETKPQNNYNKEDTADSGKTIDTQSDTKSYLEKDTSSSGSFMGYFLVVIVICIATYIAFHNKKKIIAFIIEGRNGKKGPRRHRPDSGEYKRLSTDVEEIIVPSNESIPSKGYVY